MGDIQDVISVDERKHMLSDYTDTKYQLFVATWGSVDVPDGIDEECANRELHDIIKKYNKVAVGNILKKTYGPEEFRRLSGDTATHSEITHYGAVFQFGKDIANNEN